MKYIRTKDGRIIYIGYLTFYKDDKPYTGEGIGVWEGRVPIIKAADTIEELLDKIILVTAPSLNMMISHDLWNDKRTAIEVFDEDQRKDRFSRDFFRCLGAIWTDYGLRYVAEYKDKEWKLL